MRKNKLMIKAVIFDMGGVILRTEDAAPRIALAEKFALTRQELEKAVFDNPSSFQATLGLITEKEHWIEVFKQLPVPQEEQSAFINAFWSGDRMDWELLHFIDSLRPEIRTGLLSNAWSEARASISKRFSGLEVFDVTLFSAEIGLAKPDEAIYRWAVKQLGVDLDETIFVDDYLPNITAAAVLGIHALHFKNSQQAQHDILKLIGLVTDK